MPNSFDNFPYTNFHELNLSYFIVHFREIFSQWATLYDQMLEWKAGVDTDLASWKAEQESAMETWETALLAELAEWKTGTEADIDTWETAVLASLDAWKTAFQTLFDTTFSNLSDIKTDAEAARDAAIAAQTAAETAAASVSASASQIATNATNIDFLQNAIDLLTNNPVVPITGRMHYIDLSGDTADISTPTETLTPCVYSVIECSPGDVFTINATGGNNARAYGFIDNSADGLILEKANAGAVLSDKIVIAPDDASHLIINNLSDSVSFNGVLPNDKINNISDMIDIYTLSDNFKGKIWENGTINTSSGAVTPSNSRLHTTNYIDLYSRIKTIKGLVSVYAYTLGDIYVGVYDFSTRTFVTGSSPSANDVDIETIRNLYPYYKFKLVWWISSSYNVDADQDYQYILFISRVSNRFNTILPLTEKRIVNLGDSIFGMFEAPTDISTYLSNVTGAICYNCAFGGTRAVPRSSGDYKPFDLVNLIDAITSGDYSEQIASAPSISSTYVNNITRLSGIDFSDIDIVTISYGTNDYNGNVQIGSVASTNSDFIGALIYAATQLVTEYPNLRVVFCTPIFRMMESSTPDVWEPADIHVNSNGDTLTDFVEAVDTAAKNMHCYDVNLYYLGVNALNYTQYYVDHTHPNEECRKIIAHKIAENLC